MSAAVKYGSSFSASATNHASSSNIQSEIRPSLGAEEKAFSLFQPDILLPAQYLATTQRKTYLEPEKRLMLAVLEDAVICFQKYVRSSSAKERLSFDEAEAWILDEDSHWLFSFVNICEALGLDPNYLREGLIEWKKREMGVRSKSQLQSVKRVLQEKRGRNSSGVVTVGSDESSTGTGW